jgi:hypothetical protein
MDCNTCEGDIINAIYFNHFRCFKEIMVSKNFADFYRKKGEVEDMSINTDLKYRYWKYMVSYDIDNFMDVEKRGFNKKMFETINLKYYFSTKWGFIHLLLRNNDWCFEI